MLFLRRAHSPDRTQLDWNPQPADHKTRALINPPTETNNSKSIGNTSISNGSGVSSSNKVFVSRFISDNGCSWNYLI